MSKSLNNCNNSSKSNNQTSTIDLSPLSTSSTASSSSCSSSSFGGSDLNLNSGNNVPEALQRLITSDLMYKCTETNIMETIRSIKLELSGNTGMICQIACSLLEKWCFLMVDWARQSLYFKEIKIDDQIKLLKNSWVDILLLDLMWKQCRNGLDSMDTIVCVNEQVIKISSIRNVQLNEIARAIMRCVAHFRTVQWQYAEYLALKYLVLFDPGKF
jgi:hypothetical protein